MGSLSWWSAPAFAAGAATSPRCRQDIAATAFRCLGFARDPFWLDELLPAWVAVGTFFLGLSFGLVLCSAKWVCAARSKAVVGETEVEFAAVLAHDGSGPGSAGSESRRPGVPRLRRGGGTLA